MNPKTYLQSPHASEALRGRSYGKVYKGRWRGGTVAIKIIAHDGSVASQMSALRESLLCKNITHPNVVRPPARATSLGLARMPIPCVGTSAMQVSSAGAEIHGAHTLALQPGSQILYG